MKKELVKVGMKVINKHGNIMTIVRHHISEPEKVDGVNRNGVYVVDVYICDIEPYEEPKEEILCGDIVLFKDEHYYVKEVLNDSVRVAKVDGITMMWLKIADVKKVYLDESWGNKPKIEDTNSFKTHLDEKANENYLSPEEAGKANEKMYDLLSGKIERTGYLINLDALENLAINIETDEKFTPKEVLNAFYDRGIIVDRGNHLPITQEFIESFGFAKIRKKRTCFSKDIGKNEAIFLLWKGEGIFSMYQISRSPMGENSEPIFQDYTCTTQSELRFLLTKGRIDCSK